MNICLIATMPSCYIKNCTNRVRINDIKFFKLPKEPVVRQQWLKACGKNERELPKSATICSIHFEEDCFRWTKPQDNIPPKQIWRLKENSVPTKLLNMEKNNKRKNDNKRIKVAGVPTYGQLVQHAREKQHILSDETICMDTNICKDESILFPDVAIKEITVTLTDTPRWDLRSRSQKK
ncbi:PREDICTED: 52 kDa repressor of the inhibitor of the protein kinase-like isoform X2 [Trachymyrmex cornetzi]|uniref:52 kDa repressor of the inhibitor of the protein kinase-like isoform X2 n=1 Tax=Trachymyrmex cornetzi TaxID=471704 RepID=UPI00084F6C67|nr:PREDICTED: 52 kDa repressor of the inhibitor of the protein kinase-like isoform X2 [Trachymyrmex cornetzi]